MNTPATTSVPVVVPAARQQQIALALERISEVTGEVLIEAVRHLDQFVAVLDGLIGADEQYQRDFRRAIITALHRLPITANRVVPAKLGLRVLHTMVHRHGTGEALSRVHHEVEVPSWVDLIRVYSPSYGMGNTLTLARHRAAVKQAGQPRQTPPPTPDPAPITMKQVQAHWDAARREVVRWAVILTECERLKLGPNDAVPVEILNQPGGTSVSRRSRPGRAVTFSLPSRSLRLRS